MNDLVILVILNYNQNDYTIHCIESVLKSDYLNYKILIVDNGSTLGNFNNLKKDIPKNEKVILERIEHNIGYAQGTNFGLSKGINLNPEYFLIMNNDTILDKDAIKEMVSTCIKHNKKVLVTGKVYDFENPKKLQQVGAELINEKLMKYRKMGLNEIDKGQFEFEEERDMIDDVFVLHPVELYRKLNGYSSYFWINGVNADSAIRAKREGFKLIYTPYAKLWHKGSASIGGRDWNPKLAYWGIQSTLMLRYLYLSKFNFLIFYIKTIENITRTMLKSVYWKLFKRKDITDYAFAKLKGLLYFNKWVFVKNENEGYNPY